MNMETDIQAPKARGNAAGDGVIATWIRESNRADVAKKRIQAENRERVAIIRAQTDMYCVDVDERIATDNNRTGERVATIHRDIGTAGMVAQVVRAQCDESIARIGERAGQFDGISAQICQLARALASEGISQHDRAMLLDQMTALQREQVILRESAEREAERLPPLINPVGKAFMSPGRALEECHDN